MTPDAELPDAYLSTDLYAPAEGIGRVVTGDPAIDALTVNGRFVAYLRGGTGNQVKFSLSKRFQGSLMTLSEAMVAATRLDQGRGKLLTRPVAELHIHKAQTLIEGLERTVWAQRKPDEI